MTDDEFSVYTVTANPSDYPGMFVVRRHAVRRSAVLVDPEPEMVTNDINEIRDEMQRRGLWRIPRDPHDDEVIVETWI